jgi:hypothetical protein
VDKTDASDDMDVATRAVVGEHTGRQGRVSVGLAKLGVPVRR